MTPEERDMLMKIYNESNVPPMGFMVPSVTTPLSDPENYFCVMEAIVAEILGYN